MDRDRSPNISHPSINNLKLKLKLKRLLSVKLILKLQLSVILDTNCFLFLFPVNPVYCLFQWLSAISIACNAVHANCILKKKVYLILQPKAGLNNMQ